MNLEDRLEYKHKLEQDDRLAREEVEFAREFACKNRKQIDKVLAKQPNAVHHFFKYRPEAYEQASDL